MFYLSSLGFIKFSNLEDDSSVTLKQVGYFAQLSHNRKTDELERKVSSLRSDIKFIKDFGNENPVKLRENLLKEIDSFTKKLAQLAARDTQLESKIQGSKHEFQRIEGQIKLKQNFRDTSESKIAQYEVKEGELQSQQQTLGEHYDVIMRDVERRKEQLRRAEDTHREFKERKP